MAIDLQTVRRVAHLARLKVAEEGLPRLVQELDGILTWIEQLQEVDVEGVEPMTGVENDALRMRPDQVTDGGKPADILANAPDKTADFFVVSKVVE